jgi:signal recognition particle GTPase
MNSIRQHLFDIFNNLMCLDPNKEEACTKEVQEQALNEIRRLLIITHCQVDTTEEIIALLGMKKENSK